MLGSTTMSVGPPIISKCSTLSRRTRPRRLLPARAAAPANRARDKHSQPCHAHTVGVRPEPVPGEPPGQPSCGTDQRQHGHECEDECNSLHALSPAECAFFTSQNRRIRIGSDKTNAEWNVSPAPSLMSNGKNCRPAPS